MIEKKWTVIWPTVWQVVPIPLVWGVRNLFVFLSDLQVCGNIFYDFLSFTLLLSIIFMTLFYTLKGIFHLFQMKIVYFMHILLIVALVVILDTPNSYPKYRIPMLISSFNDNKNTYQKKISEIIASDVLIKSSDFKYFKDTSPDKIIFCYEWVKILWTENELYILIPVRIYNEESKASGFEGYLYSKTGDYPEHIFPKDKIEMLKKMDDHWYLVYQYPWIQPALY